MTCIIAIETATEACSAALLIQQDGKELLYKRFQLAPREHTKLILPMLDEILEEARLEISEVDAIAFGRGPGAFTGLRIATGIAQGLALSVDKPTIAISSLMAMALTAQKLSQKEVRTISNTTDDSTNNTMSLNIIVAIDARMGEVYWAEYKANDDKLELVGEEQLSKPSVIYEKAKALSQSINNQQSTVLIGSGWDVYFEAFKSDNPDLKMPQYLPNQFPDALEVSQLALLAFEKGEYKTAEEAQPVYLRNNVAEKSKKK